MSGNKEVLQITNRTIRCRIRPKPKPNLRCVCVWNSASWVLWTFGQPASNDGYVACSAESPFNVGDGFECECIDGWATFSTVPEANTIYIQSSDVPNQVQTRVSQHISRWSDSEFRILCRLRGNRTLLNLSESVGKGPMGGLWYKSPLKQAFNILFNQRAEDLCCGQCSGVSL